MDQAAMPAQAAKDPVCGMDLGAVKTGYRSEYGGKRYYFCSSQTIGADLDDFRSGRCTPAG
jgi:YHS domain-containing protein